MDGGALIFLPFGILAFGFGWPLIAGMPSLLPEPMKPPRPSPSMPALAVAWLLDLGLSATELCPKSSNDMDAPPGGTCMLPATTSLLAPVTPRIVLLKPRRHLKPRKANTDASLKTTVCLSVSTIVTGTKRWVTFSCRTSMRNLLRAPPPVTSRIFSSLTGPMSSPAMCLLIAKVIWSAMCSTDVLKRSVVLCSCERQQSTVQRNPRKTGKACFARLPSIDKRRINWVIGLTGTPQPSTERKKWVEDVNRTCIPFDPGEGRHFLPPTFCPVFLAEAACNTPGCSASPEPQAERTQRRRSDHPHRNPGSSHARWPSGWAPSCTGRYPCPCRRLTRWRCHPDSENSCTDERGVCLPLRREARLAHRLRCPLLGNWTRLSISRTKRLSLHRPVETWSPCQRSISPHLHRRRHRRHLQLGPACDKAGEKPCGRAPRWTSRRLRQTRRGIPWPACQCSARTQHAASRAVHRCTCWRREGAQPSRVSRRTSWRGWCGGTRCRWCRRPSVWRRTRRGRPSTTRTWHPHPCTTASA